MGFEGEFSLILLFVASFLIIIMIDPIYRDQLYQTSLGLIVDIQSKTNPTMIFFME